MHFGSEGEGGRSTMNEKKIRRDSFKFLSGCKIKISFRIGVRLRWFIAQKYTFRSLTLTYTPTALKYCSSIFPLDNYVWAMNKNSQDYTTVSC